MKYVRIEGDVAYVELTQGKEALIDTADVPLISGRSWCAVEVEPGRFYARGTQTYMHRLLLNLTDRKQQADHINHNGLDNRRTNLRILTNQQNSENRKGAHSNSKTGIRGVTVHKCKPSGLMYAANVQTKGKHYAKYFPYTPEGLEQATEAVKQMRRELMPHSKE